MSLVSRLGTAWDHGMMSLEATWNRTTTTSPWQTGSLCDACQSVFRNNVLPFNPPKFVAPHHPSLKDYVAAVDAHCTICAEFFRNFSPAQQSVMREASATQSLEEWEAVGDRVKRELGSRFIYQGGTKLQFGEYTMGTYSTMSGDINIFLPFSSTDVLFSEVSGIRGMRVLQDVTRQRLRDGSDLKRDAQWKLQRLRRDYPLHTPASCNTGSSETFSLIAKWLSKCFQSGQHPKCNQGFGLDGATKYPNRLLDVENSNSDFKLVFGADLPPDQKYIALSHRWGDMRPLRLTVENMESLHHGQPVAILPQTFQDAVVLARHFGVRYLWIDSLCIVQEGDGGADWRIQATTMSRVYLGSFVTLAADSAVNYGEGLFFERDPLVFRHARFEVKVKNYNNDETHQEWWTTAPAEEWKKEVESSPLNQRGWVVQERLLSPRTLHFTCRQVYWECRTCIRCEKYPLTGPPSEEKRSLRGNARIKEVVPSSDVQGRTSVSMSSWLRPWQNGLLSSALRHQRPSTTTTTTTTTTTLEHPADLHDIWWEMVTQYSACDFTVETDRLVAIAGIAKAMKSLMQGEHYFAGHWSGNLISSLCWGGSSRRKISSGYYAPSWSWASIRGMPSMHADIRNASAGLVDVSVVWLKHGASDAISSASTEVRISDDIYGPLTEPTCALKVTGSLKAMKIEVTKGNFYWDWGGWPLESCPSGVDPTILEADYIGYFVVADFALPDDEKEAFAARNFYYTPWLYYAASPGRVFSGYTYLMIYELVDAQRHQFRRLGHMTAVHMSNAPEERPEEIESSFLEETLASSPLMGQQSNEREMPALYDESTGKHTFYVL